MSQVSQHVQYFIAVLSSHLCEGGREVSFLLLRDQKWSWWGHIIRCCRGGSPGSVSFVLHPLYDLIKILCIFHIHCFLWYLSFLLHSHTEISFSIPWSMNIFSVSVLATIKKWCYKYFGVQETLYPFLWHSWAVSSLGPLHCSAPPSPAREKLFSLKDTRVRVSPWWHA